MARDYQSSPEGKLWHAVLATFIQDAANPYRDPMSERSWEALFKHANSDWVKSICDLIDLDHGGFIDKMIAARKRRTGRLI